MPEKMWLSETWLMLTYERRRTALQGEDVMPPYWALGEYLWSVWRALMEDRYGEDDEP